LWKYLLERDFPKSKKLADTWRDEYMLRFLLLSPKASMKDRLKFIEAHLASRLITNMTNDLIDEILRIYHDAIFSIREPSNLLNLIESELKTKHMDIDCQELENTRPTEEEISSFFNMMLDYPNDENIFYHVISTYNPLTKQLGNLTSKNQLRILRPSENTGWRDSTCAEFVLYKIFLEKFKRQQTMYGNNST
jgi:hypothetical protein